MNQVGNKNSNYRETTAAGEALRVAHCLDQACSKTDIHAVEEISLTWLVVYHKVRFAYINPAGAMLYKTVYCVSIVLVVEIPKTRKVIAYSIGDDTKRKVGRENVLAGHNGIDGIVQCSVATNNNQGVVAVLAHHGTQTLNTI